MSQCHVSNLFHWIPCRVLILQLLATITEKVNRLITVFYIFQEKGYAHAPSARASPVGVKERCLRLNYRDLLRHLMEYKLFRRPFFGNKGWCLKLLDVAWQLQLNCSKVSINWRQTCTTGLKKGQVQCIVIWNEKLHSMTSSFGIHPTYTAIESLCRYSNTAITHAFTSCVSEILSLGFGPLLCWLLIPKTLFFFLFFSFFFATYYWLTNYPLN